MRAYLDHAATAPMPAEVLDGYTEALRTVGNPASTHGHGQAASARLEAAREGLAQRFDCTPAEVTLTSGGTESINLGLKGLFWARRRAGAGPVVLVAEGEHHATIEAAEWLRDAQGAELRWIPLDGTGRLTPGALTAAIADAGADRVALISFLAANNEVGTVNDTVALCGIARAEGIPVHVDAVAALGQLPIDFRGSGAALMSLSAHKVGGPVGVGALLIDRGTAIDPLQHGGSQQRGRSGTQDVAGAVGFALATELAAPEAPRIERIRALRDRLISGVRAAVPDAVLRGAAADDGRLPGNAHFTFPGCQGDSLVFLLDAAGISASVGSACRAGVAETSHVLLAMGLDDGVAAGALRFTIGFDTTEAEIELLLRELPESVERARSAGLS
ncbi:cysteine desulfurase family protein [Leucobacter iarius]|uniref:Cysteine desulfurase family protein n=1 Tax=Leucobacter iarius TaxID=333963 RepID=A0ABP4XQY0_9MICO